MFYLRKAGDDLMLHETVLLAGNLVIRIFEHGSVLDEVADSVVYVVGPESTICHDLADLVTIVVFSDTFNAASWRASDDIVVGPHGIGELAILHDATGMSAAAFSALEVSVVFLVSASFSSLQVTVLLGQVECDVLTFVRVFADFCTIVNRQNSFDSLIANEAVSAMSLVIIKANQMAVVAAVTWSHELDIIVDIVLDVFDIFVQRALIRVPFPNKPLASSVSEVFAGLLASRGGEHPSGISNDIASPEITVNVDVAHEAFFWKMGPDNFLKLTITNLLRNLGDVSPGTSRLSLIRPLILISPLVVLRRSGSKNACKNLHF